MNKTKKALLAAFVCATVFAGSAAIAACNVEGTPPAKHSHEWSAWSVADENKPTAEAIGKATRDCSGSGDCDASASDKEYALPELSSADYTVTDDTAQVGVAGTGKYKYDKNGIAVEFTAATPAKPHVHEGGVWTVTDANKPTADKKGKATRECAAADEFCDWTAADLEYELPELSSEDYEKSADTAQVGVPGEITYSYNKNGVSVEFTVETPSKPHVHEGGVWTVTDENKPTDDKKGKATRECTAADEFCDWTAADLEYELPALNETDYVVSADSATCIDGGVKTYTYDKDGVNVVIKVETPVNSGAHAALEHKDRLFMGCEYGGTEAHWECPLCGKFFGAEEGGNELGASDLAIPAGHSYEIVTDKANGTATESCTNDGCTTGTTKTYKYIDDDNAGSATALTSVSLGGYYIEKTANGYIWLKLELTEAAVYELEFDNLVKTSTAFVSVVKVVDTEGNSQTVSTTRGVVTADFADVASHSRVAGNNNQSTSFTFDATDYTGKYLSIQITTQAKPKIKMTVKKGKKPLKYGDNTINISEAYAQFIDEYEFIPEETKAYSMTVPAGVEALMNGEDFIVGEDRTVNFEGTAEEKIVFAFKNSQTGTVKVTIGDAVELPKITPDSPLTSLSFPARTATVIEVGDIENGKYTLSISMPMNIMRGAVICFAKGTGDKEVSTDYNDYYASNGDYSKGAAEAYFQFPQSNTMNGATYEVAVSGNVWSITLDLQKGDKLVLVSGGTTNASLSVTLTKV